jgi:FixJ family two-component response regulator
MPPVSDALRTVHVVDDDASLRTALTRLLKAAGYDVRAYASAGEFLLARSDARPACLLLDVAMPGPSGLDLQEALSGRESSLPIVFVTGHGDIPMSVRAMRAGAVDFLTKPVGRDALLKAVEAALLRDAEQHAGRRQVQDLRERYATLTSRERDVFARVVTGLLNKQIAAEIGCSIRTVKIHRARAMEKMQASSLADLVRIAVALGVATSASGERPPD